MRSMTFYKVKLIEIVYGNYSKNIRFFFQSYDGYANYGGDKNSLIQFKHRRHYV